MIATRNSHSRYTVTCKIANTEHYAVVGYIIIDPDSKINWYPGESVSKIRLCALKQLVEIMERIDAHPEITVIEV